MLSNTRTPKQAVRSFHRETGRETHNGCRDEPHTMFLKKAFEDAPSTEQGNGKAMTGHDIGENGKVIALLEEQIADLRNQLERAESREDTLNAEKSKLLNLTD